MFTKLEGSPYLFRVLDALEIVITLASENVLDKFEAAQDPEVLVPMRERQLEAIATIQDFFTNQVFNTG